MSVPFLIIAFLSSIALVFALHNPKRKPAKYQTALAICPVCTARFGPYEKTCPSCRTDVSGFPLEREYQGFRYTLFSDGDVGVKLPGRFRCEPSEAHLIEAVCSGQYQHYRQYQRL